MSEEKKAEGEDVQYINDIIEKMFVCMGELEIVPSEAVGDFLAEKYDKDDFIITRSLWLEDKDP